MDSQKLIHQLGLLPHPEGGYFKETYRSEEVTTNKNSDVRNVCTAIYFLLGENDKSHFHRLQSDELWFFHQGETIEIYYFCGKEIRSVSLGNNLGEGDVLSFRIPANTWFAAKLKHNRQFALVSCIVAPGFDYTDFELAGREELISAFPDSAAIIEEFTRE